MKTFTKTMYIHEGSEPNLEDYRVFSQDMTSHGWTLLSVQETEFPKPEPASKESKLKVMCDNLTRLEEDHHKATCDIEDEIKKLESEE